MKRLLFMALLACTAQSTQVSKGPERDYDTLICKPVKTYWTHATPIHSAHHVHSKCRIASYWKVVGNKWVAK